MKICTRCKIEKELTEFGRNKAIKGGYRFQCKVCRNEQLKTGKPNSGRFQKGNEPEKPFRKGNIPWNKGEITSNSRKGRKHIQWSISVKEKDGWICQDCGCQEKRKLDAHHVIPWNNDEKLRFEVNNGKTLCKSCHGKIEGHQKGHKFSNETLLKIGLASKGRPGYWKGKKLTEEAKKKMSEAKKGKTPWNKGKI